MSMTVAQRGALLDLNEADEPMQIGFGDGMIHHKTAEYLLKLGLLEILDGADGDRRRARLTDSGCDIAESLCTE